MLVPCEPSKKAISLCKVSCKALFIRINTLKKERLVQTILHPFKCWERWVVRHHTGLQHSTLCKPCPCKGYLVFYYLSYYRIFLKWHIIPFIKLLNRSYHQAGKMSMWEHPAALSDAGKARQGAMASAARQLPAGSPALVSWASSSHTAQPWPSAA